MTQNEKSIIEAILASVGLERLQPAKKDSWAEKPKK